jgi:hypothetical protein
MAELESIMQAVDGLPYSEQREIVARLQRKHLAILTNRLSPLGAARNVKASERWRELREILREVTDEDIADRSRKRPVLTARWCAVTQMRLDGFTGMEIERATGWDHATIINIDRRVSDALDYPAMYPDFVNVWNRMQRRMAS